MRRFGYAFFGIKGTEPNPDFLEQVGGGAGARATCTLNPSTAAHRAWQPAAGRAAAGRGSPKGAFDIIALRCALQVGAAVKGRKNDGVILVCSLGGDLDKDSSEWQH